MTFSDHPVTLLGDRPADLHDHDGSVVLVVNTASKCGLTPQYEGLQRLHETYADRGLVVLGFPCNQFMGQEPGAADEIEEFCRINYGVTFPVFDKVEVNGPGAHPLFAELTRTPDDDGEAGDVQWNFEKFLIDRSGTVVRRFRPRTEPTDPAVVAAIEDLLRVDG